MEHNVILKWIFYFNGMCFLGGIFLLSYGRLNNYCEIILN